VWRVREILRALSRFALYPDRRSHGGSPRDPPSCGGRAPRPAG